MGRSEYAANVVQESVEEIQEITFEIGMLEQYRQDLSDPRKAGALSSEGAVFGSHQAAGNGEGGRLYQQAENSTRLLLNLQTTIWPDYSDLGPVGKEYSILSCLRRFSDIAA